MLGMKKSIRLYSARFRAGGEQDALNSWMGTSALFQNFLLFMNGKVRIRSRQEYKHATSTGWRNHAVERVDQSKRERAVFVLEDSGK